MDALLETLFAACEETQASDVHLATGLAPRFRVRGALVEVGGYRPFDAKTVDAVVHTAKIQEVCRNVQTAVKEAIQNMTGRVVTRVDVSVTGIAEPPAPAEHPDVTAAIEP